MMNAKVLAIAVMTVLNGLVVYSNAIAATADFDALVAQGQAALARVETSESAGREHVEADRSVLYPELPPTSGPHYDQWVEPGFYGEPQKRELLVHALEHGNIVIYYDRLDAASEVTLRTWAEAFSGQWDGVVVVPLPGIGANVILTAWQKKLVLSSFEAASAAAFIDAYRGRGPEHPVR